VQDDAAAALAALRERTGAEGASTVGFCFGGTQSFLAATNEALGLEGVIGFYGSLSASGGATCRRSVARATCAARAGLFGGADEGIPPDQVEAFDSALAEAGVEHEIVTYPGAPHSFFDRSYEEHAEACADAWRRVLAFL
jgi:carboxymethylenebutenolidase